MNKKSKALQERNERIQKRFAEELAKTRQQEGKPKKEQLLAVYFDIPSAGSGTFMTTAEISDKLVIKGSIKKPMSLSKLGMILQQQGFRSKRMGKLRTRGWIVRERDAEEINANRRIYGREVDQ